MNIGLLSILHNREWDFRPDLAQTYAGALKNAIELHLDNDIEKKHGYFLSKKGYRDKDGRTVGANFEDKLYVGNIHRIESHLYWNDEELQDDDQIINVVVVDGPITRDGGGCSYGSKDWRDQVMYANTIEQVVGHLFIINTPGGEAASRNDYEMMFADCREKNKPTVAFVDGMCCSSGVNLASRCDRVVVMNPKDEFGCIGTMAAFWAVAHDTVDQDGFRYVELVGKDCPEKNAWWREAAKGEYEKLQADLDRDTEQFHATVRENRPLVTDDMLSGKVFEAQEVIPALVDEIGDMERAIECVFALADETMTAARFMTAPDPEEKPDEQPDGKEPEELARLNAQQKAAINKEKGNLTVVDDGHVSAEREGILGPHMEEIATPKNKEDMTDEEKMKAQEAEAAQAPELKAADQEEQKPGQEETKPAEEEAKPSEEETKPAEEETKPSEEETKPAEEETKPSEEETKPAEEETKPSEEETKPAEEETKPSEEETKPAEEETAEEREAREKAEREANGGETNAEKEAREQQEREANGGETNAEKAARELREKAEQEARELAEQTVAEKDREIAEIKSSLAEEQANVGNLKADIAGKDAEIEALKKQVADLKAEVKELSGKETPMVDAGAGIPAGNATGGAPKVYEKRITRENMTYQHCREVAKERQAGK